MRGVLAGGNNVSASGLGGLSLELDGFTVGLGGSLLSLVGLDSVQEFLSALRVLDVFHSDVESLFDVSVTDNLVADDTNRGLGHVVDNTGLTVVELEGHTTVDGGVGLDVDNVTDLVGGEVGRKVGGTTGLLEPLGEHVSRTRSKTKRLPHG